MEDAPKEISGQTWECVIEIATLESGMQSNACKRFIAVAIKRIEISCSDVFQLIHAL